MTTIITMPLSFLYTRIKKEERQEEEKKRDAPSVLNTMCRRKLFCFSSEAREKSFIWGLIGIKVLLENKNTLIIITFSKDIIVSGRSITKG